MNAAWDQLPILWTSCNSNVGDIFQWILAKELKLQLESWKMIVWNIA